MNKKQLIYLLIALLCLPTSCKEEKLNKPKCKLSVSKRKVSAGDKITYSVETEFMPEGAQAIYYFDNKAIDSSGFDIGDIPLGRNRLKVDMMLGDSLICSSYKTLEIISNLVPVQQSFSIENIFPHQLESYTQGLEWNDGKLYEGTGRYGFSLLAEVDHRSGKHTKQVNLDNQFFGEGITILNGRIYQLTYRAQKCFVYDLSSLEKIDEFEYSAREGWGLTNDGASLIMSDGSHKLVFIDPNDGYKEWKTIEVFAKDKKQGFLNELEYVDGKIYANIYQSEDIAVIDASTGKVLAMIDCSNLLDKSNISAPIDVLNGIAYNPQNDKFYLTGKLWPSLFEISLN